MGKGAGKPGPGSGPSQDLTNQPHQANKADSKKRGIAQEPQDCADIHDTGAPKTKKSKLTTDTAQAQGCGAQAHASGAPKNTTNKSKVAAPAVGAPASHKAPKTKTETKKGKLTNAAPAQGPGAQAPVSTSPKAKNTKVAAPTAGTSTKVKSNKRVLPQGKAGPDAGTAGPSSKPEQPAKKPKAATKDTQEGPGFRKERQVFTEYMTKGAAQWALLTEGERKEEFKRMFAVLQVHNSRPDGVNAEDDTHIRETYESLPQSEQLQQYINVTRRYTALMTFNRPLRDCAADEPYLEDRRREFDKQVESSLQNLSFNAERSGYLRGITACFKASDADGTEEIQGYSGPSLHEALQETADDQVAKDQAARQKKRQAQQQAQAAAAAAEQQDPQAAAQEPSQQGQAAAAEQGSSQRGRPRNAEAPAVAEAAVAAQQDPQADTPSPSQPGHSTEAGSPARPPGQEASRTPPTAAGGPGSATDLTGTSAAAAAPGPSAPAHGAGSEAGNATQACSAAAGGRGAAARAALTEQEQADVAMYMDYITQLGTDYVFKRLEYLTQGCQLPGKKWQQGQPRFPPYKPEPLSAEAMVSREEADLQAAIQQSQADEEAVAAFRASLAAQQEVPESDQAGPSSPQDQPAAASASLSPTAGPSRGRAAAASASPSATTGRSRGSDKPAPASASPSAAARRSRGRAAAAGAQQPVAHAAQSHHNLRDGVKKQQQVGIELCCGGAHVGEQMAVFGEVGCGKSNAKSATNLGKTETEARRTVDAGYDCVYVVDVRFRSSDAARRWNGNSGKLVYIQMDLAAPGHPWLALADQLRARHPDALFDVHMSPPCAQYSGMNSTGKPTFEEFLVAVHLPLVCLAFAHELAAQWTLENPVGRLFKLEFLRKLGVFDYLVEVHYCQHGGTIHKPTIIACSSRALKMQLLGYARLCKDPTQCFACMPEHDRCLTHQDMSTITGELARARIPDQLARQLTSCMCLIHPHLDWLSQRTATIRDQRCTCKTCLVTAADKKGAAVKKLTEEDREYVVCGLYYRTGAKNNPACQKVLHKCCMKHTSGTSYKSLEDKEWVCRGCKNILKNVRDLDI